MAGYDALKACAEEIAARLADGRYPPGEWLPSLQVISDDSGFSRGTVERALPALAGEGLICHVPGKGHHPAAGGEPGHAPRRRRRGASAAGPGGAVPADLLSRPYITPTELAAYLRVSKMTVYRAIENGRIPGALRVSPTAIRLPSDGVRAFIEDCARRE